jgi:hypothetical protein
MDLAMGSGAARAGRGLRWSRACVLAVVAVTTSATAHAVAGGRLPQLWTLVLAGAVVAAVAEPLLRRPASTRRVLVLLAGAEACAHLLLTVTAGFGPGHPRPALMPATAAIPGMAGMGGMEHLTGTSVVDAGVSTGGPLAALGLSGQDVLMTDAHLAAVVLIGFWLAAGERALWTVLALTLRPVTDAVGTLLVLLRSAWDAVSAADVTVRVPVEDGDRRPPCSTPAARSISHRGPPRAAPLLLGV